MGLLKRLLRIPDTRGVGCGIYPWILSTPEDPLHTACVIHDKMYTEDWQKRHPEITRKEADREFLFQARRKNQGDLYMIRAYIYYGIIRLVGFWFW